MLVFNFLNFLPFFLIFYYQSGRNLSERFFSFFIFPLSRPFPTYFGLKRSDNGVFQIFEFFCFFFLEFSVTGRVRTHKKDFFLFFLFLSLSQFILAGKVSKMVVFSFFNFFCYFLEFSITSWVGTHRNDFFLFLFLFSTLSRPSPTYFGLERSNNGVF